MATSLNQGSLEKQYTEESLKSKLVSLPVELSNYDPTKSKLIAFSLEYSEPYDGVILTNGLRGISLEVDEKQKSQITRTKYPIKN